MIVLCSKCGESVPTFRFGLISALMAAEVATDVDQADVVASQQASQAEAEGVATAAHICTEAEIAAYENFP